MHDARTYRVAAPVASHYRPATCAEVECEQHQRGWATVVDEATDLGRQQAAYIRQECASTATPAQPGDGRRRYRERRTEAGWTAFEFPAGQTCFGQHRVPLERPYLYLASAAGHTIRHTPDTFIEDSAGHLDKLHTIRERG